MPLNLADAARARRTKRWHMFTASEECSLSSHSFMVAMLAEELVNQVSPDTNEVSRYHLMRFCLLHDLDETVLGDWPGPVKSYMREFSPEIKSLFNAMSEQINPQAVNHRKQLSEELLIIVKLADKLDALFFIETFGCDPDQAESVTDLARDIETLITKAAVKFPGLKWGRVENVKRELYGRSTSLKEVTHG